MSFTKLGGRHELVLAGHEDDGLDLGGHEPVGVGEVEFELEIAEFAEAADDGAAAALWRRANCDGEAVRASRTLTLRMPAAASCAMVSAFLDGEPRVLAVAGRDGDDDAVEEARGPAQDVQMPERDRIEGAGIDGGAERLGASFSCCGVTLGREHPFRKPACIFFGIS
jgi:hypothetical protein